MAGYTEVDVNKLLEDRVKARFAVRACQYDDGKVIHVEPKCSVCRGTGDCTKMDDDDQIHKVADVFHFLTLRGKLILGKACADHQAFEPYRILTKHHRPCLMCLVNKHYGHDNSTYQNVGPVKTTRTYGTADEEFAAMVSMNRALVKSRAELKEENKRLTACAAGAITVRKGYEKEVEDLKAEIDDMKRNRKESQEMLLLRNEMQQAGLDLRDARTKIVTLEAFINTLKQRNDRLTATNKRLRGRDSELSEQE